MKAQFDELQRVLEEKEREFEQAQQDAEEMAGFVRSAEEKVATYKRHNSEQQQQIETLRQQLTELQNRETASAQPDDITTAKVDRNDLGEIHRRANGEVVLGGTGYHNNSNTKVDADDTRHILETTSQLIPSLKRAPVLEAWVGLRPGRPSARLEKELRRIKDEFGRERGLKVVHNYGHGGSGLTMHWGCAVDATDLVFQCMAEGHQAKL